MTIEVYDSAGNLVNASELHASTHILGGTDEIDGDKIDIDFTPSNYTPSTAPAEVDDLDHLTAHLKGVDDGLAASGSIGTHDRYVSALAMYPASTSGCGEHVKRELATNDVDLFTLAFDESTDEIAKFDWVPPGSWDAGTVKVTLFWTCTGGASSETIEIEVSAVAFGDADGMDAAFGTPVAITDTWGADDDLHITAQSSAITIGGSPAKGDLIQFKLLRDVSADTLSADMELIGAVVEFTTDASID
tara:strand:+ start:137 stop:877 length:741 start_codon:yes stop_codon:yes gene_type:complete